MKKKKKRKRSSRVCVLERLARGAWSHGEGGGEWLGPLDCADKNGSSCERGEKPAVPLSISVFHLAAWAAVHDCHVRPIQAVQVVPGNTWDGCDGRGGACTRTRQLASLVQ